MPFVLSFFRVFVMLLLFRVVRVHQGHQPAVAMARERDKGFVKRLRIDNKAGENGEKVPARKSCPNRNSLLLPELSRLPWNNGYAILGATPLDPNLEADADVLGDPLAVQYIHDLLGCKVPHHRRGYPQCVRSTY